MPAAKLNNISLYYEQHGKGEPLLLISGLSSDNSSWLNVVRVLSSEFMVVLFDNRDCGRSDYPEEQYTIGDMAGDVIGLMDFLKIKRAHVIGHSMGGYIAQELAIDFPDRIGKAVLESTAPVSSEKNNTLFNDMYDQNKREGNSEAFFRRWTELLFAPGLLADSLFINTFIKNSVNYHYLQTSDGFKRQIGAIAAFDAREKINRIKAKTLVLAGKHDKLITPEESEMLSLHISGSVFRVLDGAAHCIHIEAPELYTNLVLEFLKN